MDDKLEQSSASYLYTSHTYTFVVGILGVLSGRRKGRPRFESGSREEDNNCPEQGTASGRRGDNCPNPETFFSVRFVS